MKKLVKILGWVVFLVLLFVLVGAGGYAVISTPFSVVAAIIGILNWFGWTPRTPEDFLVDPQSWTGEIIQIISRKEHSHVQASNVHI